MVTVKPEPQATNEESADGTPGWTPEGELRLNLSALGVDHLADGFGERLCQLSSDNPGWQFEYSAEGELIIVAPPGSESSRYEGEIIGELYIWRRANGGMSYPSSIGFHLPNGAQRIPDAAWITQERYDALAPSERRGTIYGAPDFVVEVRSRTDGLPPFLAEMREWMNAGVRLGWGIDASNHRVYLFRAGQDEPEVLETPESLSGEGVMPGFTFDVRRLIFDRHAEEPES